uniref:branched-chain amino acid ABC transporter permease n=1 Tax=Nocardioides sp. TaxID=35761 RepID=UPI002B273FFD
MRTVHTSPPRRQSQRAQRSTGAAFLAASLLALLTLVTLAGPLSAAAQAATPSGSPAQACEGTPIDKTVKGTLINNANDGAPVPGVAILVTNCDGEEFPGETAEDGSFEIPITSGFGIVTVSLDPETLPEGVTMREGARTTNTLTGNLTVLNTTFLIGPDNRSLEGKWDRVPGLIYSGLLFGLIIALAALGLNMIYGTTGLTNFAHGELVSFGAIVTFFLSSGVGIPFTDAEINLPFLVAVPITVILAMGFGYLQDSWLWRPLRRRGTGLIAAMIVTIGLGFFLRNMYAYFTGSRFETYAEYFTPAGKSFQGLFTYTDRDLLIGAICILTLAVVIAALSYTRLGRATRAVADNPALAAATGINVDRVISLVWIVGTALTALAGVFLGFQLGVTYQIGQLTLLLLFAAITVGGLGSIWGAVLGAVIIGLLTDLS